MAAIGFEPTTKGLKEYSKVNRDMVVFLGAEIRNYAIVRENTKEGRSG